MKQKRKGPKTSPPRKLLEGPIHDRIRVLREAQGLTQEALANEVGVHKTAVSHWELRLARPDLGRLTAIAKALKVTVAALIDGEEKVAA